MRFLKIIKREKDSDLRCSEEINDWWTQTVASLDHIFAAFLPYVHRTNILLAIWSSWCTRPCARFGYLRWVVDFGHILGHILALHSSRQLHQVNDERRSKFNFWSFRPPHKWDEYLNQSWPLVYSTVAHWGRRGSPFSFSEMVSWDNIRSTLAAENGGHQDKTWIIKYEYWLHHL